MKVLLNKKQNDNVGNKNRLNKKDVNMNFSIYKKYI